MNSDINKYYVVECIVNYFTIYLFMCKVLNDVLMFILLPTFGCFWAFYLKLVLDVWYDGIDKHSN